MMFNPADPMVDQVTVGLLAGTRMAAVRIARVSDSPLTVAVSEQLRDLVVEDMASRVAGAGDVVWTWLRGQVPGILMVDHTLPGVVAEVRPLVGPTMVLSYNGRWTTRLVE